MKLTHWLGKMLGVIPHSAKEPGEVEDAPEVAVPVAPSPPPSIAALIEARKARRTQLSEGDK